jgi:hypothetical protein
MTINWTGNTNVAALAIALKPYTGAVTTKTSFLLFQLGF